jgi:hypothetical protein
MIPHSAGKETNMPKIPETVEKRRSALPELRETPRLNIEQTRERVLSLRFTGDKARLLAATGNAHVLDGLVKQIAALGSHGHVCDEAASNFALGFTDSMAPEDPAETLLVTQMAAIHQATMMMARRLNHVETIQQQDAAEKALNKLARTYATQVDSLKRYRSKGQQTVRVERVTVQDGGQAIVGNVETGGRGRDES